jgi:hypothetical protein
MVSVSNKYFLGVNIQFSLNVLLDGNQNTRNVFLDYFEAKTNEPIAYK